MALRRKLLVLCALGAFTGTRANAVPPPPPPPGDLTMVQAFIRASIEKDLPLYTSLLSDGFVGADGETGKTMTKSDWLDGIGKDFQNKWLHTKILNVFYGARIAGEGLDYRAVIVEELDNYPDPPRSDCCTYYRIETLDLKNGKVSSANRSIPFETQLSSSGKRTDIPN